MSCTFGLNKNEQFFFVKFLNGEMGRLEQKDFRKLSGPQDRKFVSEAFDKINSILDDNVQRLLQPDPKLGYDGVAKVITMLAPQSGTIAETVFDQMVNGQEQGVGNRMDSFFSSGIGTNALVTTRDAIQKKIPLTQTTTTTTTTTTTVPKARRTEDVPLQEETHFIILRENDMDQFSFLIERLGKLHTHITRACDDAKESPQFVASQLRTIKELDQLIRNLVNAQSDERKVKLPLRLQEYISAVEANVKECVEDLDSRQEFEIVSEHPSELNTLLLLLGESNVIMQQVIQLIDLLRKRDELGVSQ